MAAELSRELQEKIRHARSLPGRPHEARFFEPATISEILQRRAAVQPDSMFLTFLSGEQTDSSGITTRQFYDFVRGFAADMHGRLGIRRGDRIATALHNHE